MATKLELEPVSVSFTLKDHIRNVLRDAILKMNIYEDETDRRLDERVLAEQLGISRTPVREALARLEQDGFVEILPRKGAFVRRMNVSEILEMIIVWAALESMAARLVVGMALNNELDQLRQMAMVDGVDSPDFDDYSEANIRFHQSIINLADCNLIREKTEGLFLHMHAVRRRAMKENNRATHSVHDHLKIVDALKARDAELSSRLVREHTMQLHGHIQTHWIDQASSVAQSA